LPFFTKNLTIFHDFCLFFIYLGRLGGSPNYFLFCKGRWHQHFFVKTRHCLVSQGIISEIQFQFSKNFRTLCVRLEEKAIFCYNNFTTTWLRKFCTVCTQICVFTKKLHDISRFLAIFCFLAPLQIFDLGRLGGVSSKNFLSEIGLLNRNILDDPPVVSTFIIRIYCTICTIFAIFSQKTSRYFTIFACFFFCRDVTCYVFLYCT
jgi:hypothetical protein